MGRYRDVELDDIALTGPRLELRRWQAADADRVVEVMRDRSMYEFLALPEPYTREDALEFVTTVGHEGRHDGTGLGCAIVERATGRVVGASALRINEDADVGYWIAPDSRGQGYAAEATRLLAQFGFELGLPRIRLDCDVRNLPSAVTALATGFAFEGVARDAVTSPGHSGVPSRRGFLAHFARLARDPGTPVAPTFPRLPADGLTDGVITLRTLRPDDAVGLDETDDAESVRWSFTGQPRPPQQVAAVATRAGLDWLVGNTARFAIVDVATGAFAGEFNLRQAGPPQIGGVGYGVHPAFRGRGYTSRGLRLLAPWAFEHVDLSRLELGAKSDNRASQRAAANAGFVPDGVRALRMRNADGTFGDEVRFALLNPRYL
jgi:RimJ/RimL family protein N-acetyltransferase